MMPVNTGGGVNERLTNQDKISKKEDNIRLLQCLRCFFFFFAFMCYIAFISKQANNKTAKSEFLLREFFFKSVWDRISGKQKKKPKQDDIKAEEVDSPNRKKSQKKTALKW